VPRKRAKSVEPFGITQEELEAYRQKQAEAKRLSADVELRRKSLLSRALEGATLEPGPLEPQVTLREVRRFSADEVARIMGVDVCEEIRTQLKPTIERHFSVVESEAKAA
jgi:hypothetical protein